LTKKKSYHLSIITVIFSALLLANCSSAKKVAFESPVDTTAKKITTQLKKTYSINELGVYASNEFDGARLNGFKKLNDSTALVIINPENTPINNSPYFAFKTWSSSPKDFYFTFQYPKGFKHRYAPKLMVDNHWDSIDSTLVSKNDSIVTIKLSLTSSPTIVSGQEIQSSSDVKNWYTHLISGKESFIHIKSAGKSTLGRDLPVLDIYKGATKGKPIIVLLTRQHPPEVTGFYAFQEFLKTIIDSTDLSQNFLNKYRVLAFPILNPDGVDLGHWRHNAGGVDTNRDWSRYNQPEIKQVVKFITKTSKKNKSQIVLGLDFHSTWNDVFYTNKLREGTTLPNFIENWFASLERNIPNYKVNEVASNSTRPVSKGWFLYGHNAVGITYEIGDATPKEDIIQIGKVSAEQMMKILSNN
jgi:cytosolic carboxypeptidase protein 6